MHSLIVSQGHMRPVFPGQGKASLGSRTVYRLPGSVWGQQRVCALSVHQGFDCSSRACLILSRVFSGRLGPGRGSSVSSRPRSAEPCHGSSSTGSGTAGRPRSSSRCVRRAKRSIAPKSRSSDSDARGPHFLTRQVQESPQALQTAHSLSEPFQDGEDGVVCWPNQPDSRHCLWSSPWPDHAYASRNWLA